MNKIKVRGHCEKEGCKNKATVIVSSKVCTGLENKVVMKKLCDACAGGIPNKTPSTEDSISMKKTS